MYTGPSVFSQIMAVVPWQTFKEIVRRYDGDAGVTRLTCAELFRVMLFAQLTYRESLRDIDTCLAAHPSRLYHMGISQPPAKSTMADALGKRDWRIYQDIAYHMLKRAKTSRRRHDGGGLEGDRLRLRRHHD